MQDQELIPVVSRQVGSQTIPTVNARRLHEFLEIGKDFSNWIKDQIARARLVENRDFVIVAEKGENSGRGRSSIEYHLTVEAGKHIGMMCGTDKGFAVRDYFIECERVAKSPATDMLSLFKMSVAALEEQTKRLAVTEQKLDAVTSDVQFIKDNVRLHQWQCYELRRAVNAKVDEFHKQTGVDYKQLYPGIWNKLKVKMQVSSYQSIPAARYDDALSTVTGFTVRDMPDYVKAQALDLQGGAA